MKTNFSIQDILRTTIRNIKAYSSARDEFTGTASVFLDANENSFGSVGISNRNRYPDPHQKELKQIIASQKHIKSAQLFLGNGSDEAIDLVFRAFCEPDIDNVLIMPPTYGMYQVCADVNGTPVKKVQLSSDFQINTTEVMKAVDEHTKVIFICSPNNPTANVFDEKDIGHIIENFQGVVVIDEAYADFSSHKSWTEKIDNYPNLIVLQTFSKAWGLANIRLGMAFANVAIIEVFDKIKLPYNVNGLTQDFAKQALEQYGVKQNLVKTIIDERKKLTDELKKFDCVKKIYPSETNFLLIEVENPKKTYDFLIQHDIVVRDRSTQPLCNGCLRITIGKPEENHLLLTAFEYLQTGDNYRFQHLAKKQQELKRKNIINRQAKIKRQTKETNIHIQLKLDNSSPSEISTGLHFFDHMLEQLIRHSGSSAIIKVQGDLEVDEHHTIEDTALAIGQAFSEALADKRGIERYGFLLPMDDSQAQVALDFSGRPWFIWDVQFSREKVGDVPTEMFEHFFKSFSDASKCNLHIKARGKNEHHKIEAIFKAVAKSIKAAVKQDRLNMQLPSTKGLL